ncbi:transporter [Falsiroseomonas oryzae]|uniref:transporter n=1 Tax=Falsiroseomonas oryzae TaxID=2766473 RepID=UPI0022EAF8F6|nr:transporter [Roseomonas sp. MO-31]
MAGTAHATDVHPGDYIALPPGLSALVSYSTYADYNGANINGTDFNDGTRLRAASQYFRLVHYTSILNTTVSLNLFLPFGVLWDGKIAGNELKSASGFIDPIIGSTIWVVNNPQAGRWVGVSPLVSLPLGTYDNDRILNTGENRFRGTLEVGWVETLVPGALRMEIAGNVNVFSDNNSYGPFRQTLSQRPSYQLQPWLTYTGFTGGTLSLGYLGEFGGTQQVDGIDNGFATERHAIRVNAQRQLAPMSQLSVTATHDLSVSDGFRNLLTVTARLAFAF